jgi:DNA gyrase subunit A
MTDTNTAQPDGDNDPERSNLGTVVDQEIERELHDSYLTYAMSTITDRALPDVRDGLKPSQRRILVAMHDLNLLPGRKHRKCAKIAGDTSGNYHPHGESVIYPTLVNLAQDWKMRIPLIDKQGNFGSIDGDPPAAMRYTEARFTAAATEMLADIKFETVEFKPNYDETRAEPKVLPARFPNLLVNGSNGIAVGMACSMPPHNLSEICDAIERVLDEPDIDLTSLLQVVQGPDFPTGGIVVGRSGIARAYASGRGKITLRGVVHQEKINGRECLVIDEIPYQVVQNNLIEKIVDAVKAGRIEGISDVKNFSGKKHRTRIVVQLKMKAAPEVVERLLYKFTPLQGTYSIINIALDRGRPRTMGLRQLIDRFVDHRIDVIRRRTEHLLREAKKSAHRLEGLILAVCDIDDVIAVIRGSKTREEAIEKLMARRFVIAGDHEHVATIPERLLNAASGDGVSLSRVQADAIGALRLIQLVGLEIDRLVEEYTALVEKILGYEVILGDPERVLNMIREDCRDLKSKYGSDRQTQIIDDEEGGDDIGDLITEHRVVFTMSHNGYVKRVKLDEYKEQARGGVGVFGAAGSEDDFPEHLLAASSHDDLLCFTDLGRVFRIKVWQIPEASRTGKGRSIVNVLRLREQEQAVAFLAIPDFEKGEDFLLFATKRGKVKRTALRDYRNVNISGINAINLNETDGLVGVIKTSSSDDVILATANGMSIRFNENDARVMGRSAAGVKGISLAQGDEVIGIVRAEVGCDLLTVTERGYGKRTDMDEYLVRSEDGSTRPQSRGGKGRRDIRTDERNGRVVAIRRADDGFGLVLVSEQGKLVRIPMDSVSRIGRNTMGVRLVKLRNGDRLVAAAITESAPEAAEEVTPPDTQED